MLTVRNNALIEYAYTFAEPDTNWDTVATYFE